jgi:quinol monooxygenase YgiN
LEHVIGWITVSAGRRTEFMTAAAAFVAATRAEPGVLFFELLPSGDDADVVIAIEGYRSADLHRAHLATAHFAEFWTLFQATAVSGRFENIIGGVVRTDVV